MKRQKLQEWETPFEMQARLAQCRKRGPVVPVRRGDKMVYLRDGEWLPRLFNWLWRRLARKRK